MTAELDNTDNIVLPADLEKRKGEDFIRNVLEQESAISRARRTALSSEVEALRNLQDFLLKEVASIEGQMKEQEKERRLVREESENVTTLAEKGLVVSPRRLAVERMVAQLEGDRLRLETSLLRAKQENSRTEIAILEARNLWATDVTTLLRETDARLSESRVRLNTARNILYEVTFR